MTRPPCGVVPCVVLSDELRTRCQAIAATSCDDTTVRARARFHDLRLWRGVAPETMFHAGHRAADW